MMEAAAAIRAYTSNEIAPLLNTSIVGNSFHPQTVPAYAANKNFALLASKFRDYAYREAALNPINLANRAVDWEADIINDFRRSPHRVELITERETHNGRVLNLSHPIISTGPCLSCHEIADKAPRSMILAYGTQNGFGWKLNEVVGAQIVSVPMAVALEQAASIRNLFVGVLGGVFVLLITLFNLLPILMMSASRINEQRRRIAMNPRAATAQSMKAFGHGLLAAGIVVAMVVYTVIYARGGVGGLRDALNPLILSNYMSLTPVIPGALTILLARIL